MQLKRVGDQVVVLMGASSGIGRETALRFARKGAKVVVSARGEEGLDSLVEEIRRRRRRGYRRPRRHFGVRSGEGGRRPGRTGVREARHVGPPRRGWALRHLRRDDA